MDVSLLRLVLFIFTKALHLRISGRLICRQPVHTYQVRGCRGWRSFQNRFPQCKETCDNVFRDLIETSYSKQSLNIGL